MGCLEISHYFTFLKKYHYSAYCTCCIMPCQRYGYFSTTFGLFSTVVQSEYRLDTKPWLLYSLSGLSSVCDANWYIESFFLFGFSNINLWKCHTSATLTNSKKMRLNTKHTLVQSVSAGIIYILRLGPSHSQLDLSPLICPLLSPPVSGKMILCLFLQYIPRHQDSTHLIYQL